MQWKLPLWPGEMQAHEQRENRPKQQGSERDAEVAEADGAVMGGEDAA